MTAILVMIKPRKNIPKMKLPWFFLCFSFPVFSKYILKVATATKLVIVYVYTYRGQLDIKRFASEISFICCVCRPKVRFVSLRLQLVAVKVKKSPCILTSVGYIVRTIVGPHLLTQTMQATNNKTILFKNGFVIQFNSDLN